MAARYLIAASAAITIAMGLEHLRLLYFSRAFSPRDSALEEKLKSVPIVLSNRAPMWSAWVGFNVSHSMGPILFGLVYGYLALVHSEFLFQSQFLMALGAATLLSYIVVAWRYWFYAPLIGVSAAFALYAGGIVAFFST